VDQLAETAKLAEAGDVFDEREILALLNHRLPSPSAGTPLLRSTFYFKEALRVALNTATALSVASMAVDSAPKAFSEVSPMLQFAHSRHRRPRGWSPRRRRTRRLPLRPQTPPVHALTAMRLSWKKAFSHAPSPPRPADSFVPSDRLDALAHCPAHTRVTAALNRSKGGVVVEERKNRTLKA
jgi:hypothetical protein